MARVAVVGAGISGLVGARILEGAGHEVTVLDKGRKPGGRMATRRPAGRRGPVFDHGAQFVTLREEAIAEETSRWIEEGWLVEWFRGSPDIGAEPAEDDHPRFRGNPYMRSLPEKLAAELTDVRCNVRVSSIRHDGEWIVRHDDGGEYGEVRADALLCTAPAPQSLDLLEAGDVELSRALEAELRSVTFAPCIAILAEPEGKAALQPPGIRRFPDDGILDVVVSNASKGVSRKPAVTIHANGEWSRLHWDDADDIVGPALTAVAREHVDTHLEVVHIQKWRYSTPTSTHDDLAPGDDVPGPVRFAGDAFAGGRVEGAALSGHTAAHRLLEQLAR